MSEFAQLHWDWDPVAPLISGYSQNLAQAAGKIERGAPKVVNLETRDASHTLRASFLTSSVKGVFRTAAAWLVERTAHKQGAKVYVTCDYGLAVPERRRPALMLHKESGLCPVCRVFGGTGCLGGDDVAPARRQQGRVRFTFTRANNATYGQAIDSPEYNWAWEQIDNRGKPLVVEQLTFEADTRLEARLEPADDFALALLWLAGDLVSSGFFRFGRFTTRGYGVVRLRPAAFLRQDLNTLLSGNGPKVQTLAGSPSGREAGRQTLGTDPLKLVAEQVKQWWA